MIRCVGTLIKSKQTVTSFLPAVSCFRCNFSTENPKNRRFYRVLQKTVPNFGQLLTAPKPALVSAGIGLVPLVLPAAYMFVTTSCPVPLESVINIYSLSLLAMMGGVRLGRILLSDTHQTLPDAYNLGWSAVAPTVACLSLAIPSYLTTVCLLTGHVLCGIIDMLAPGYPEWFRCIRFIFCLAAVISLWICLVCSLIQWSRKE